MSEKPLMIVNATPNLEEQEAYEYYVSNAGPLFKKFGGMPFVKYKISEAIVGTQTAQVVVVMQFPNNEAIKNVFDSEAYKALLPYREKAFKSLTVFIGNQSKS
ncbi:MAG: DUF1330 domain-containing protein [Psychroserpens sp.]|uniref:DUF1330 domain-containing protein n=1 Tax=Psychroserpens sp. TaxID=2020870 RepID=UPI003001EAD2